MLVQVELDEAGDLLVVQEVPSPPMPEVSAVFLDRTLKNGCRSNHHQRSLGPHCGPLWSTAGHHYVNSSHLYQ